MIWLDVRLTDRRFDAEGLADQGEQRGGEVHGAVLRHRHVHADQLPVGQSVGTLPTEAYWGLHVA